MEVNPGRWLAVGQRLRRRFRDARARVRLARGAGARVEAGSEPVDHRDRHHGGDATPSLPAMEATQIVGTHDPDETHARTMPAQIRDGLVGIRRADLRFQIGDVDARMVCERLGRDDAIGQRGKPTGVFMAIRQAPRCASCGGSNVPPNRPTRIPGAWGGSTMRAVAALPSSRAGEGRACASGVFTV
jgi:hypothetical protein